MHSRHQMRNRVKAYCLGLVAFGCLVILFTPARADTIYVSNYNDGTIDKVSSNGTVSVFATGLNRPEGLALDSSGYLYVADSGNSCIMKFDPNGNSSVFASTGQQAPSALAFDRSGNLYVSLFGRILEVTPSGSSSLFASSGVSAPGSLAFGPDGDLYVANTGNNTIEKFDSSGRGAPFVTNGLSFATGLAFDSSGNLYVTDSGSGQIDKFDPSGNESVFASGWYPTGTEGLAFDSDGKLNALIDGAIFEFNASGVPTLLSFGLSSPMGIAIETVPEPDTRALLLAGLIAAFTFHQAGAAVAKRSTR